MTVVAKSASPAPAKQKQVSQSYMALVWWKFKRNRTAVIGGFLLLAFISASQSSLNSYHLTPSTPRQVMSRQTQPHCTSSTVKANFTFLQLFMGWKKSLT